VSAGRESIRVLMVDDHPLFRSGIAALLATQPDMRLVADASNGREAIQQFRAHHPDITVMDLQMREMNGPGCHDRDSRRISRSPNHCADYLRRRCAGAARHAGRRPGLPAEKWVVQGIARDDPRRPCRGTEASAEASHELAEHATDDPLTPGEFEVLWLIPAENSNRQMAALSVTEENESVTYQICPPESDAGHETRS